MNVALSEMLIAYLADRHGWSKEHAQNAQQMIKNCMDEGASENSVCQLVLEVNNLINMSDSEIAEVRQWYEEAQTTK